MDCGSTGPSSDLRFVLLPALPNPCGLVVRAGVVSVYSGGTVEDLHLASDTRSREILPALPPAPTLPGGAFSMKEEKPTNPRTPSRSFPVVNPHRNGTGERRLSGVEFKADIR